MIFFTERRARRLVIALMMAGAGVAIFGAFGSLLWPRCYDHEIFSWVADVILDGGVPYKDAWEVKGPLTYYVFALVSATFGPHDVSIRIVDLVVVATSCYLLRRIVLVLREGDTLSANFAAILFAVSYYSGGFDATALPDGWGGSLALAAVSLLLEAPRRRPLSAMIAAGTLLALATLLKPTFVIYVLLLLVAIAVPRHENRIGILSLSSGLAAFCLILAATAALLYQGNALRDFADTMRFLYTSYAPFSGERPFSQLLVLPSALVQHELLFPMLCTLGGIWFSFRNNPTWCTTFLTVWFLLGLCSVLVQGKFWAEHFLPADMAMAALLGVAMSDLRNSMSEDYRRLGIHTLLQFICVATLIPVGALTLLANQWPGYALGTKSREQYITEVTDPWNHSSLQRVATYISQCTGSDDKILVWGFDIPIYGMSRRRSATRFGNIQPLYFRGPLQSVYREIFMRETSLNLPRYIVLDTQGAWFLGHNAGIRSLDQFPEFRSFLRNRYALVETIDVYQIWRFNR